MPSPLQTPNAAGAVVGCPRGGDGKCIWDDTGHEFKSPLLCQGQGLVARAFVSRGTTKQPWDSCSFTKYATSKCYQETFLTESALVKV